MSDQPNQPTHDDTPGPSAGRSGPQQGWAPPLDDPQARAAALNHALDYRGDITLELTDGRVLTGYIYDRRPHNGRQVARMMLAAPAEGEDERVTIDYDQIARLVFSGRDPAAGKSWETWIRQYAARKLAGEKAEIASEPLE